MQHAIRFVSVAGLLAGWMLSPAPALAQPTAIAHDPIPFAVRGQPLTLKAKVTGAAEIDSVTLYYALFRDAAPFRVPMKSTGLNYYVGTIDAGLLTGVDAVSYYIEAQDKSGALTETPWYEVTFRKPDTKPAATETGTVMPAPGPAGPAPVIPISRGTAPASSEDGGWKTPALIAGGAAVVLGGAYALSDSGGGGGGGSDDDDDDDNNGGGTTNDPSGTYAGTVTTCFTPDGGSASCQSSAMQIVIDSQGTVFSETIYPGQQLTDSLDGSQAFTLSATVADGGTNGVVNFEGAVVGSKILGSVSGSATTPDGQGTYSGSFSADKQ